jgi:metal-responsive CopG/Arc/MetJ family transcriptional regulator
MRTTVSLDDDLAAYVDEQFASEDESDAQAIREAVRHAHQQDQRVTKLQEQVEQLQAEKEAERERLRGEIDELHTDVERLQNEKRLILKEREEKQELVEYVEEERSVEERRRKAGLRTRAKWWLFGMDDDEA